jgi:hypothetical protein
MATTAAPTLADAVTRAQPQPVVDPNASRLGMMASGIGPAVATAAQVIPTAINGAHALTNFFGRAFAPAEGEISPLFGGSASYAPVAATTQPTTWWAQQKATGHADLYPGDVSLPAPIDHSHPDNPGAISAQEMVRRTANYSPYQMDRLRQSYAPLVAPRDLIMGQQFSDENADYAQRAADYKAGKPVLGGADGKTPLGPHDIFGEHQTALRAILQANPMYNMGAAGMVTSPTGN